MSPLEDAGVLVAQPLLLMPVCAARPPRRTAVGDRREKEEELEEDEDE